MNAKWKNVTVRQLCKMNQSSYTSKDHWGYINYLDTGSITRNVIEGYEHIDLTKVKLPSRAKRKVAVGDIIYSTVRPNLCHYGMLGEVPENCLVSTGFAVIKADEAEVNPRFLYYYLTLPEIVESLHSIGEQGQATYPAINPSDIEDLEISIPERNVQNKIVAVLSDYDAAIANCRKQIALLEEAAMRLYREWFGDGKGEKGRIGDIANIIMGQSPSSDSYNYDHEGLPFHQGVTGFGVRFPVNEMWCRAGTRFANAGDILFSVRAPVGRINVSKEKIVIGRGLSAICEKRGFQCWLLYALKSYFTKENMIGSGCIFASTTKNELFDVKLPYPGGALIQKFNAIVQPIDDTLVGLDNQIRSLTEARDRLLPKLMKGEIAV